MTQSMTGHDERVLVVDDNQQRALALKGALESQGFSVAVAADGTEALELARSVRPVAIVSDVVMPNMDGFRLCWEVRQSPELRGTPVILASAVAGENGQRGFAFELGADAWIDKTMPREQLGALVRETIEWRGRRPIAQRSLDPHYFAEQHQQRLIELAARETEIAEGRSESLTETYRGSLRALVAALDIRDTGTSLHSQRVAEYALALGQRMGLGGEAEFARLLNAAMLCDIGDVRIPEKILAKPGPLTKSEWRQVQLHPEAGRTILADIEALRDAAEIVLAHHERWDGQGYPRRLEGESIPVAARLIPVADALDAITSGRPYRAAESFEHAIAEIAKCAGTQFDPEVVKVAQTIEPEEWETLRTRVGQRGPADPSAGYL